jgi:hypothetical protein
MTLPFPEWPAGMRITAGRLNARNTRLVEQGSDQTVTSSTTLVSTNLILPGVANATYEYRLQIAYSATVTPDLKFAWTVPSGAAVRRFTISREAAAVAGLNTGAAVIMRSPGTGTEIIAGGGSADGGVPADFFFASDEGQITMGGTAGNCTVQFAQQTSNANQTIFRAQSRLVYRRIG